MVPFPLTHMGYFSIVFPWKSKFLSPISDQKFTQIESAMQTGKAQGNTLLNKELVKPAKMQKVLYQEALSRPRLKRSE